MMCLRCIPACEESVQGVQCSNGEKSPPRPPPVALVDLPTLVLLRLFIIYEPKFLRIPMKTTVAACAVKNMNQIDSSTIWAVSRSTSTPPLCVFAPPPPPPITSCCFDITSLRLEGRENAPGRFLRVSDLPKAFECCKQLTSILCYFFIFYFFVIILRVQHPLLPRFKGEVLLAPAIKGNPPPSALVSFLRYFIVPLIPRWQIPSCLESGPSVCWSDVWLVGWWIDLLRFRLDYPRSTISCLILANHEIQIVMRIVIRTRNRICIRIWIYLTEIRCNPIHRAVHA